MPTSRRIVQFANVCEARVGTNVVYIDGAFDVFHVGHVAILKVSCRLVCGLSGMDGLSV